MRNRIPHDKIRSARYSSGFTLVELMIVVVIIGVLASIAIPSYQQYVIKAARSQAKGGMLNISQLQERYFTNNNGYLLISAPPAAAPTGWKNFSGSEIVGSRKYDITVAAGTTGSISTSYLITATPSNSFSDPTCGILTLDSIGTKTPSTSGCW